jgi:hypothetical protein
MSDSFRPVGALDNSHVRNSIVPTGRKWIFDPQRPSDEQDYASASTVHWKTRTYVALQDIDSNDSSNVTPYLNMPMLALA